MIKGDDMCRASDKACFWAMCQPPSHSYSLCLPLLSLSHVLLLSVRPGQGCILSRWSTRAFQNTRCSQRGWRVCILIYLRRSIRAISAPGKARSDYWTHSPVHASLFLKPTRSLEQRARSKHHPLGRQVHQGESVLWESASPGRHLVDTLQSTPPGLFDDQQSGRLPWSCL